MQRRSLGSAGIRLHKLDYGEVIKALSRYAKEQVRRGALAVVLIGSLARGDYTAYSDADLIIIIKESRKEPAKRISQYIDPTLPIDTDVMVYTLEEILRMAKEGRRLVKELITYGKLLAGSKEVIDKLRKYVEVGLCNLKEKRNY